jgi:hypothetical protein
MCVKTDFRVIILKCSQLNHPSTQHGNLQLIFLEYMGSPSKPLLIYVVQTRYVVQATAGF